LRTYKNAKKKLILSNNGEMKHLERFKKMVGNSSGKIEMDAKEPVQPISIEVCQV
jgi:hypothetical protein